ncbi:hypothetical protein bpuCAU1_001262 (plasmid) [Borrelia puertoricensis]|uniref:hypothetical protein n=1 Tax=Borrelia puertoricensis TaxID=2756107 RepID=UPI001FF5B6A0|nr:hypothetical protein [Borrelia puertoricensis]UPA18993.1 hypothetical protein bpuSUM_001534 [Borrelia puertoricensis]
MVIKKLFLKLLFVVSLFVFLNACTKESENLTISEDFTVSYLGNKSHMGRFALNLVNSDGTKFIISYNSYSDLEASVRIYLDLGTDINIELKDIKLNGKDIDLYDRKYLGFYSFRNSHYYIPFLDFHNKSTMWRIGFYLNFDKCRAEWKKLIADAKGGYLKFSVLCVDVESGLKRKYEFRVSAANFSKFVELVEQVHVVEVPILKGYSEDLKQRCYWYNNYCEVEYAEEFKSGSIKSISFIKIEMTEDGKESLRNRAINDGEREMTERKIQENYPRYSLKFSIVGEYRIINIKQVIFDGVEAKPSIFRLDEPDKQLAGVKDFQMGPADLCKQFLGVIFPVLVSNTFTIHLKKRLVEKLKEKPRIKITLISVYGDEFIMETDNFIKKYNF